MTIPEIYELFDKIGCLTFTTVDETGMPISRIAHLRGYDDHGIYFMTMFTKQFYTQLKQGGKLAICGLHASTQVHHGADGMPQFDAGYAARMSGHVREVPMEELCAKQNPMFDMCIKDWETYQAMVVFCITDGAGDVFDYDFETVNRDHKLQRTYFSFHGGEVALKGLQIQQDKCISCGLCQKKCSFSAIAKTEDGYAIAPDRCDECGDCYLACPAGAIAYGKQEEIV